MSLRTRLSLISSLLFLIGISLGVSFQIINARVRVAQEMESVATLSYQLLSAVLRSVDDSPEDSRDKIISSLHSIVEVRHLDISVRKSEDVSKLGFARVHDVQAPAWFVYLVQTDSVEIVKPLENPANEVLVIRTNPADEIAEVWVETKSFIVTLLLVLLPLNGLLFVTVGAWLKPVKGIVAGLESVEKGDFTGKLPKASLPELKVIVEKLNHLTKVLRNSKAENDRLVHQSLQIQERERQHLVRELHDEMGQSVSAIKAIAFSIAERTRAIDEASAKGAVKIGSIASTMSGHVRNMMHRLRPPILDELGLIAALQHMTDAWKENHRDTYISFRVAEEFGSLAASQQIYVYRIIQEALTNVAKHARADRVDVELTYDGRYEILITDNGRGFVVNKRRKGIGMTGIRERAQALNGYCNITSDPNNGVRISINFPGLGKE
ncbi:MAG: sensor histidine kinase [Pseudomonadota bacterium]